MRLLSWAKSDTGLKRAKNEDSFLHSPVLGLFAVADGMGGHKGGARASSLAIEVLADTVASGLLPRDANDEDSGVSRQGLATSMLRGAVQKASAEVHRTALLDESLQGMGTTLTTAFADSGWMHLAHVGDSRAYVYRGGLIRQLSLDHSWTAEQVRSGLMSEKEAEVSQFRHVITRSVGYEESVEVDTSGIIIESGDCFLLCSDGMSNYVQEAELREIMSHCWFRDLPQVLVDLANERGGDDNITVVVVYAANHLESQG